MDEETLITAEELASFLRTSTAQIYNSISKGQEGIQIPKGVNIGRRRLWLKSEVLAWVKALGVDEVRSEARLDIQPKSPRIRRF